MDGHIKENKIFGATMEDMRIVRKRMGKGLTVMISILLIEMINWLEKNSTYVTEKNVKKMNPKGGKGKAETTKVGLSNKNHQDKSAQEAVEVTDLDVEPRFQLELIQWININRMLE